MEGGQKEERAGYQATLNRTTGVGNREQVPWRWTKPYLKDKFVAPDGDGPDKHRIQHLIVPLILGCTDINNLPLNVCPLNKTQRNKAKREGSNNVAKKK